MDSIPQKELRNDVGAVLRRVEAGESLLVTVAGRAVAELVPARGRRWVSGPALAAVFASDAPQGLHEDLTGFGAALEDPFA